LGVSGLFEGIVLFGEICKWLCNAVIPLDEFLVEIGVAKEGLYVCNGLRYWLFLDGLDFVFLYPYFS